MLKMISETRPHARPTTTPASMIPRQGWARKRTRIMSTMMPEVTEKEVIFLLLEAWKNPMQKKGPSRL